jgi:hypothetical protein
MVNVGSDRLVRGDPSRRPLELAAFTSLVRTIAGPRQ